MKATSRKPTKAGEILRGLNALKLKVRHGEMIEVDQVSVENAQVIIKKKRMRADEFFRRTGSRDVPLHGMTGEEVAEIRKKLGLSQAAFARWLAAGKGTVRQWEQKKGIQTGPGLRLLHLIRADLPAWRARIHDDLLQNQTQKN